MKELFKITEEKVVLDCLETWPMKVIELIEKNIDLYKAFMEFEKDMDKKLIDDFSLRLSRPKNPYFFEWNSFIGKISKEIQRLDFVGFHCTRLTKEEIANIKKSGLQPLSSDLINKKLLSLLDSGTIDMNTYHFLLENNLSQENNRKGRIWFFFCIDTLNDVDGLYRLFRSWGGEAIYNNNENLKEVSKTLSSIGKPCIVLGNIKCSEISSYESKCLAEKFLEIYYHKSDIEKSYCDFDLSLNREVGILGIIKLGDDLFEELTGFSKWPTL